MSENKFYNLSYNHDEIESLLRKIASGRILSTTDYEKLVNVIGIDNISTFSGNYYDLSNVPNIPEYMSEIKDDIGMATTDSVNQKLDVLYDRLVTLINEYENENEGIFANQDELDKQLQNLSWSLREYVEQQISLLPLTSFATKVALTGKSDIGHAHKTRDIEGLDEKLDYKSDIEHLHDGRYGSKQLEHFHTDLQALNTITQSKVNYWDEHVDILSDQILIINEKLKEVTDSGIGTANWDSLHRIAHPNLEVLNEISNDDVESWNNLKFKTEKTPVTTQTVGGLEKGTDISGYSIHTLLERILLPDTKPELSARMVTNPSGTSFEKGNSVKIEKVIATISGGSNPVTSVELYVNGTLRDSKTPTNGSVEFIVNDTITSSISAGYYKVKIIDSKQYSSTINLPAINFFYPCYFGIVNENIEVENITADMVKAMTKVSSAKGNMSYSYTTKQQRMVIAYPVSYGNLTSILDPNGFEQIRAFEKNTIKVKTADGDIDYYVYANNASTNSNFKLTFKF